VNVPSDHRSQVCEFLKRTTQTLAASLSAYWPSDSLGRNDPAEQNLVIHFGHQLLTANFAVFGEGLQWRTTGRIDLVALAPADDWFLAFEAKRLLCNKPQECADSILADVRRLRNFWLSDHKEGEWLGTGRERAALRCRTGIGIVGGLLWSRRGMPSPLLDFSNGHGKHPNGRFEMLSRELIDAEATLPTPMLTWQKKRHGQYHLLAAYFVVANPSG
jgi:hypothetical protein